MIKEIIYVVLASAYGLFAIANLSTKGSALFHALLVVLYAAIAVSYFFVQ